MNGVLPLSFRARILKAKICVCDEIAITGSVGKNEQLAEMIQIEWRHFEK